MHEMSLVQNLIGQLTTLAAEHSKKRVVGVTVGIGPLSGVVIDSFRFAFEVLSAENELTAGARLTILNPPATYRCVGCGHQQSARHRPDHCPECKETLLIPAGGNAIVLNQVELE